MQKNPNVKILVSYHKPSVLFKDEVLTPIHLGRALSKEAHKDGKVSDEEYEWLCENMIGDDTGENISHLNRYFNEMTGIYWAWKNYDKLGNPEYIGLCHYRRHFIFDEYVSNFIHRKFVNYYPIIENISKHYQSIIQIRDFNCQDYDLIIPKKFKTTNNSCHSVYEYFAYNGQNTQALNAIQDKICSNKGLQEYAHLAKNLAQKQSFYPCNMFIMKKELFFEYCEFVFAILLPLYEEMKESLSSANIWQKRELGFTSEQLTSLFIERQLQKDRKYKEFEVSFVENPNNAKFQDMLYQDTLKKIMTRHKVISFDLFDTLLVRPYAKPIDVFKHLEESFGQKDFASLRSRAEFKAMKTLNKKQVNFDEIYSQMPNRFHFLQAREKELELQTLYINPLIKNLCEMARSLGKKVIFVSDMYHSKEFITEILTKNGICDFDKLYVSADIGKTKHHKDLYQYILKELDLKPEEMLHIGDNKFSDFENAKELGITAFYLPKPMESFLQDYPKLKQLYEFHSNNLTISIILGLCLKKWLYCDKDIVEYWSYLGYFYGGVICYGLSKFVFKEALKENLKEMIFIARDGYVIEKIFNLLQEHLATEKIQTHYVQASRSLCNEVFGLDLMENTSNRKAINLILSFKEEIEDFKVITYPNKNFVGFYWFVSALNKVNLVHTYSNIYKGNNEYKIIDFLEFFITAPEFSASSINEDLSFKRKSNYYESSHINIYKQFILKEELAFSKDLLETFGTFEVEFEYEVLKHHIEFFQYKFDFQDIMEFFCLYKAFDDASLRYIPVINLHPKTLFGAPERVKNHLAYKLGSSLVAAKSFKSFVLLPLRLIFICFGHLIDMRIKKFHKLPPLEAYADYLESLKYKKHLSYRLGSALLNNPLTFAFKISQIYREYKGEKQ
ncbi:HAD-IA family hydrolase [Helicobacter sp. UBA3407]|uniref:HAD-IA family hydrolase n=1 Tax=Helicobacter sp. UBA3407 TaxID=1946588 RepID=UPI002627CA8F|nr:HAD-IA family hydrolase [Helicobacter sp. UBA3407]